MMKNANINITWYKKENIIYISYLLLHLCRFTSLFVLFQTISAICHYHVSVCNIYNNSHIKIAE